MSTPIPTLEHTLEKVLKCTPAQVSELVARHGGDVRVAARATLTWTREDHPTHIRREVIERALLRQELEPWAAAHDALTFLREASLLELDVTLHHNPTYPCLAFRVPLKACVALAHDFLKVKLADELVVYAIAMQALQQRKVLKRAELERLLRAEGLAYRDVSTLTPFPPEILEEHVLGGVDVSSMAPGEAMQHAPKRGIDVVRERKQMTNRIVYDREHDTFQINEGAEEFVEMILALNVPVSTYKG